MTLVIFSSGFSDSTLAIARPALVRLMLRDVVDLAASTAGRGW